MKKPKTNEPKPLNIREQRFCEFIAEGMKGGPAAKKAGWKATADSLNTIASRLLRKVQIIDRIAALRAKTEQKMEFSRESLARHLFKAATTPPAEITEESAIASEVTIDVIGGGAHGKLKRGNAPRGNETIGETVIRKRVKGMDKVAAARLLCEMMGWKEPEQVHQVIDAGPNTLDMVRERARAMGSPLAREATNSTPQPNPENQ